jgi:putative NADH-flavin reductase
MKVLVFGASGKTGGLVVERALAKGHDVTVLVRDASRFKRDGVRVLVGDATKREDVSNAMQGQAAVIDTIGGTTPYKKTRLETTAAHNIIEAMQAEGISRLIVVSAMGVGSSRSQAPAWYKYLLLPTFLRGSTEDKTAMELEVNASRLDYVITRPAILKDGPPTGSLTVLDSHATGHQTNRSDLANFIVDQLSTDEHLHRAITVVNN